METAEVSETLWGDKPYQIRAREALPILVRQALVGETIFYSDLAEEIGIPNARNLNYVLGCIGSTLIELSQENKEDIPAIQGLVVNKNTGLPGEGFGWFISESDFKKLDKKQKRKVVDNQHAKTYSYPHWLAILKKLNLEAPVFNQPVRPKFHGNHGEGEKHKLLKEFVARTPSVVGLPLSCPKGETEFSLPSGDSVDVQFFWNNEFIAVEVKSEISNMADVYRGLFQCVKYQVVSEAMLAVAGKPQNVRTVLILESSFPSELLPIKNMLGIEVISNVKIKS